MFQCGQCQGTVNKSGVVVCMKHSSIRWSKEWRLLTSTLSKRWATHGYASLRRVCGHRTSSPLAKPDAVPGPFGLGRRNPHDTVTTRHLGATAPKGLEHGRSSQVVTALQNHLPDTSTAKYMDKYMDKYSPGAIEHNS